VSNHGHIPKVAYLKLLEQMIDCKENEDGSFTISWDENDPIESILNDWTEEDFIKVIIEHAEKTIEYYERKKLNFDYPKRQESNYEGYNQTKEDFYGIPNSEEFAEQSAETRISKAVEKDWQDFWDSPDRL
jgi:hypothetical protein